MTAQSDTMDPQLALGRTYVQSVAIITKLTGCHDKGHKRTPGDSGGHKGDTLGRHAPGDDKGHTGTQTDDKGRLVFRDARGHKGTQGKPEDTRRHKGTPEDTRGHKGTQGDAMG